LRAAFTPSGRCTTPCSVLIEPVPRMTSNRTGIPATGSPMALSATITKGRAGSTPLAAC
jgi:hypothetical protein